MMSRRSDRVLELDRAAGSDDRGGEQRGDVTSASSENSDRCRGPSGPDRSAPDGASAKRGSAARGGTAAGAASETNLGQNSKRPQSWSQARQLVTDAAHLPTELAAALAVAQMPSGNAAGTDAAIVCADQLLADLRAGCVAGLKRLCKPDSGAHQERFHGRN
jgi:hypothetical protein